MVLENVKEMWTEMPKLSKEEREKLKQEKQQQQQQQQQTDVGAGIEGKPATEKTPKPRAVNKDRFISKMFLRGDSVILVLKNPL